MVEREVDGAGLFPALSEVAAAMSEVAGERPRAAPPEFFFLVLNIELRLHGGGEQSSIAPLTMLPDLCCPMLPPAAVDRQAHSPPPLREKQHFCTASECTRVDRIWR